MKESAEGGLVSEVSPDLADSPRLPSTQTEGVASASTTHLENSSTGRENQKQVEVPDAPPTDRTKSPSDLECGTPEGELGPLLNLLERPPGDVAGWAIEQVRDLSDSQTHVESTQIFKLATAVREAPADQKEALVASLLQGVGDLPVQERAEAVRLFTKVSTTSQDVGSPATASNTNQGVSSTSAPAVDSVLSANFSRIAEEAAITEMPPEELRGLTDTVQKESQGLVQPFIDVVPELTEEERKRVTETLVSKGFVSEENRTILEDTIKPGGHADQFANLIWWCKAAYRHSWLIWGMLVIEGVLSASLASMDCSLPVLTWLVVDLVLGSIVAIAAGCVRHIFRSTYKEFCDDALETMKRLQAAYAEGKLGEAVPGVKLAAVALGICLLFMVFGAIWACAGVSFFSKTVWTPCPAPQRLSAVLICSVIASIRFGLVVALVLTSLKTYRKIQQFKNHSAEPLLAEGEQSYGTVEA